MSATKEPISFERQIKPLFRDRDRQSMKWAFDLWSHDDVARNSDAILARLRAGTMPCDGACRTSRSPSSSTGSRREHPPKSATQTAVTARRPPRNARVPNADNHSWNLYAA